MYLAQNLKFLRKKAAMKQEELAEKLGVARSTVGNWEAGKREPELSVLVCIADYFGVTLDDLIRKDLRPSKPQYAKNIRFFRLKHGMKQEDIAELLKISNSNASKYENGEIEPPITQLMKLADFFGVTLDQMVKHDLSKEG